MAQTGGIGRMLTSRKYIHKYAVEYGEKYGKNPGEVEKDIIQAKKYNHISFGEYDWTGFFDLNQEQKKTVSTLWTRMEYRKKFTDRRYIGILMNKYMFSKVYADFYKRKCFHTTDVTEDVLKSLAGDNGVVVYKPNCKGQGKGVKVLPAAAPDEIEAAMDYIRKGGKGIVEEYICQDETFQKLNPNAVNIIRFYSVNSPYGSYLFAPVMTSALYKNIANGCQDAVTAMVDIRTGEVISDAVDQNEIVDYSEHPVTGVKFKGIQINYWEETLEMMKKAVKLVGRISNVGWDVTITKDGPVLIEGNTIPGFNTAQYSGFHWITDGYGYQPLFDAVNGTEFKNDGRYEKVIMKL